MEYHCKSVISSVTQQTFADYYILRSMPGASIVYAKEIFLCLLESHRLMWNRTWRTTMKKTLVKNRNTEYISQRWDIENEEEDENLWNHFSGIIKFSIKIRTGSLIQSVVFSYPEFMAGFIQEKNIDNFPQEQGVSIYHTISSLIT